MNREMILRVADAIEAAAKPDAKPDYGFNMATFGSDTRNGYVDMTGHDCGTVACIAGWVHAMDSGVDPTKNVDTEWRAQDILDLPGEVADELFWGPCGLNMQSVTPAQAVIVLRHLAETGEVDWSLAARDQTP